MCRLVSPFILEIFPVVLWPVELIFASCAPPDSTADLPLHPLTAHIIGAVDSEGMVVQPGDMQDVECAIYPAWNRTLNPGKTAEDFMIRISVRDGVVDFVEDQQPFWLGGREVEAYECW